MEKISFNDLASQWNVIKKEIMYKIEDFFESCAYIDGKYVEEFENNFALYTKSKHAVGVSNGTDGLKLAIQSLAKEGLNTIIIPANTFIADALAVTHQIKNEQTIFNISLIDCDEYYQIDVKEMENFLENNWKKLGNIIIIPVHLYGHPCDMESILNLKDKYNFKIIEDASQSHGSYINNIMVGNFGDITVYSLYPGKNLGAVGDAGVITTNDSEISLKIRRLKNYGSKEKYYYDDIGWNNRMDGIQGLILNEKLKHLDKWNNLRIKFAEIYNNELLEIEPNVIIPKQSNYCTKQVYHIYCLRVKNRQKLQEYLNKKGITTLIHYPIPIQKTKIYNYLDNYNTNINTTNWSNEILSLPIHPFLTEEQVYFICTEIKNFYSENN